MIFILDLELELELLPAVIEESVPKNTSNWALRALLLSLEGGGLTPGVLVLLIIFSFTYNSSGSMILLFLSSFSCHANDVDNLICT